MSQDNEFNPFKILPRSMMLRVLLNTFKDDAKGDFKNFMDYKQVSSNLRDILSDEKHVETIVASMPTEFNLSLYCELKQAKNKTQEERYQGSIALLFLNYLYSHVNPFPNDTFLSEQFEYYCEAMAHIKQAFFDYPMVMYVTSYVSFYIAKRLLVANPQDNELRQRGAIVYKLAIECVRRASALEHPLATLFERDMELQLIRKNVRLKDLCLADVAKAPSIDLDFIIKLLAQKEKVNLENVSDEAKIMLMITWQKLSLENCRRARDLFTMTYKEEKLLKITEYFYTCFLKNNFQQNVLAYNPLFVFSKQKKQLLYLLKSYNVQALTNMHQGFRVYYPSPDSVLLSALLRMSVDDIKANSRLINHFLSLPQRGTCAWRVAFCDAYRGAIDDGTLKEVSQQHVEMMLTYFSLIDRGGDIGTVIEREARILDSIFHCNDEKVHKVALAVCKQMLGLNTFDPLGHIDHQDLLLWSLYQDSENLTMLKTNDDKDYDRMAKTIVASYKIHISVTLGNKNQFDFYQFIAANKSKINQLSTDVHQKFSDSGFLKSA